MGFGASYWAIAALVIRSAPEMLFANENRQIMTYVGIVPASYVAMRVAEAALGISPLARVETEMIMTAFALLLDGAALMWFPQTYENAELMKRNSSLGILLSRRGAASILWGAGAGLVFGLLT